MKPLKYQLFMISSILLCLLITLVALLINSAFEEKMLAKDYKIKNHIAEQLNTAIIWQAIERGLGVSLLGNCTHTTSELFPKFIEMGKKGDIHILQAQKWITQYHQFDIKLHQWHNTYDLLKRARQQIAKCHISKEKWIEISTANINNELTLHNFIFTPHNQEEQIVYLNSVLRPNITRLTEFAGLERALVANSIARNEPFSFETLTKLNHYHARVEHYIEQVLLLKGQPATSLQMEQALVTFEKAFLHTFSQLREKVFTANKKHLDYPVTAETWFDAATQTINTGLQISILAGEQTNTLILKMEAVAKKNLILSFVLLLFILLIFSLLSHWSKNSILIPCIKMAEDLKLTTHQICEAKKLLHLLIESEQKVEQEIIERKRAEQEAKNASLAKSRFLATMTHELRTPLNGILGFAQNLQRNTATTPQQQHGLEVIEHSGQHLLSLINDVLDMAKVEAGKIELYETNFQLSPLIQELSEIIALSAQQKNIDFQLEYANDIPTSFSGDEKRLRQILLNLLGNAVKFTETGKVTLQVSIIKEQMTFLVKDTGVGLSEQEMKNIFDPFQQGGDKKNQIKGTGLGLSISKNLITLMGGTLQVTSDIGVGSTFWFNVHLPIVISEKMIALTMTVADQKIIFPHVAEVQRIYDLSLKGDITAIKERLSLLSQAQFKPFVKKMNFFLKHYQLNKISTLLEQMRTKTNA